MILFSFLPLIVVILSLAKWERDKVYYKSNYVKAYQEGVVQGLKEATNQWNNYVELMAKKACNDISTKYPLEVKVIKREEFTSEGAMGTITKMYYELPTLGISIYVHPKARFNVETIHNLDSQFLRDGERW